jgi:hypothetical protein
MQRECSRPPPSAEESVRRESHRLAGVAAVKSSKDNNYQLVNSIAGGGFLDAGAKPSTPDPRDTTLSKRTREEHMIEWRHKLRCAGEKVMARECREDDSIGGEDVCVVTTSTLRGLRGFRSQGLLRNSVECSIPGSQEVRHFMRFDIQGYRIRHGVLSS